MNKNFCALTNDPGVHRDITAARMAVKKLHSHREYRKSSVTVVVNLADRSIMVGDSSNADSHNYPSTCTQDKQAIHLISIFQTQPIQG
jgi:hypothetical protein